MMKKLIILYLLLLLVIPVFAQLEVKEGSFKEVPGFVNINPDPNYQTDDNDLPFAVLKVRTENINDKQRRELKFSGNAGTFIVLEYKDGEVWVYLTAKYADYIKISHPDLSSTEFYFPIDLKPKSGYELTLVNTSNVANGRWGSLTIITKPKDGANIVLNGRSLNQKTPYTNDMIPVGKYDIILSMDGFKTTTKTVDIGEGNNIVVKIEMICDNGEIYEEGAINGIFSVSPNKMVKFSRGNLQYQASTNTWRFAENQWNFVGGIDGTTEIEYGNVYENGVKCDNSEISPTYGGWIDLFGWGTSGYNGKDPWMTSTESTDYGAGESDIAGTSYDWGVYITISNGGSKNWRTLTRDEWVYVFNTRSTSTGIRYAKAMVNGVNGVILIPDNWSGYYYSLNNINKADASFSTNRISQTDWTNKLESNGAIFLPAAGHRLGTEMSNVCSEGCYMSSSYDSGGFCDSYCANGVYFSIDYLASDGWGYRDTGCSVRLVKDY